MITALLLGGLEMSFLPCLDRKKTPVKTPSVIRVDKDSDEDSIKQALSDDYERANLECMGRQSPSHLAWYKLKAIKQREMYERCARRLADRFPNTKGWDWRMIAVLHGMEGGFDLKRQILNGESWKKRTKLVPKGQGPFISFEQSVIAAFELKERLLPKVWTAGEFLWFCEQFNGLGYRRKGKRSIYLYSYSDLQQPGKYVRDHVYDPNAVSLQVGVIMQLKALGWTGVLV